MIDPEIRDIITPELVEGEALLWAEKTDPDQIYIPAAQFRPPTWKDRIVVYSIIFVFMLALSRLFDMLAIFGALAIGYWEKARADDTKDGVQISETGGYVLTNLRLFELNLGFNVRRTYVADKLKTIYMIHDLIVMRPVGKLYPKEYSPQFLSDQLSTFKFLCSLFNKPGHDNQ